MRFRRNFSFVEPENRWLKMDFYVLRYRKNRRWRNCSMSDARIGVLLSSDSNKKRICRVQNPDIPQAGPGGAVHSGAADGAGRGRKARRRVGLPGDKGFAYPPDHRRQLSWTTLRNHVLLDLRPVCIDLLPVGLKPRPVWLELRHNHLHLLDRPRFNNECVFIYFTKCTL